MCARHVVAAVGLALLLTTDAWPRAVALPLDAPRHLTVLDYTPRVVIAWTHDGAVTTGFEVERATLAGTPGARPDRFTRIGSPRRDARRFRDPTSHAGMTYAYRIRAVGPGTVSPYSKELIVSVRRPRARAWPRLPGARLGIAFAALQG